MECVTCEGLGQLDKATAVKVHGHFKFGDWRVLCPGCGGTGIAGGVHYALESRNVTTRCGCELHGPSIPCTDDALSVTCPMCKVYMAADVEEALACI